MSSPELFVLAHDTDAAERAAASLFETVGEWLVAILPASAEILHVGATVIPGCLTKGDLDVVVRVEPVDFPAVEASLAAMFGRNAGSVRTNEFAAFEDSGARTHVGVQLTVKGGTFDFFHSFMEALRSDPELVRRYNALKLAHDDQPMEQYRREKDAFITEVLRSR